MGAVLNGLSLAKVRPYGSSFLIFSDYSRPALRLSALMEIPVIYIFTHDSIGVGEDGPTHQPVEHLASLRAIPGLTTLRPADANESEVSLCVTAYEQLKTEGIKARVVSMPSWELFEQQSPEYRESVIPAAVTARVSVEQAATFGWSHYVSPSGQRIGMKTFGASAPLKELQKKFGFTPEHVVAVAKEQLTKTGAR